MKIFNVIDMIINIFSVVNVKITVHYILKDNIVNISSKKHRTEICFSCLQSLF
jgi:hypothetical protein